MYCDEAQYMAYQPLSEKWRHFKNIRLSHAKRFACCALTIRYIIHSCTKNEHLRTVDKMAHPYIMQNTMLTHCTS